MSYTWSNFGRKRPIEYTFFLGRRKCSLNRPPLTDFSSAKSTLTEGTTVDYVALKFKNVTAYLPADATLAISSGKGIKQTSAKDRIRNAKAQLEEFISAIAESIHQKLSRFPAGGTPSTIELSFTIGFSAELDAWVIGGKAEQGIELKLIWAGASKEK